MVKNKMQRDTAISKNSWKICSDEKNTKAAQYAVRNSDKFHNSYRKYMPLYSSKSGL
jgi:hypothetical protein